MTSSVRLHRSILAAALALATLPALADSTSTYTDFSQTVFFGDSLTDSGFYQPVLVAFNGPSAAAVARFTTNPGLVYAEFFGRVLRDQCNAGVAADSGRHWIQYHWRRR